MIGASNPSRRQTLEPETDFGSLKELSEHSDCHSMKILEADNCAKLQNLDADVDMRGEEISTPTSEESSLRCIA